MRRASVKIASIRDLVGASGRRYFFESLMQERPRVGRVLLAKSGDDRFVLKEIPKNIFSNFNGNIRPRLRAGPFVRLPMDTIQDQRIFVYKYLDDDFLSLVKKQLPLQKRKQILKASLRGIAELHDRDVIHLDIKPDNIMVNCSHAGEEVIVEEVQITDLENAAYLPSGRCIKGMLAGNDNWRSPEAHFKGELNRPSDVFSFAAVCVYAVLEQVIFGPDDDFEKHRAAGALPALIRLQRQVSYFGDQDGLNGLIKHVGNEEVNCQILRMLWEERAADYIPYRPFSDWPHVEDMMFKDLIRGMTSLDHTRRITARQALEHPWFVDVDSN